MLSHSEDGHEFAHRSGGLVERGFFFRGELDLDNLLDAPRAQFHWYADVQSLNAVLALEVSRARENFLFVLQNRFDHFDYSRRWRVVRRPGFQEIDDFRAAFASAIDNGRDPVRRQQVGQGNAGYG